MNSTLRGYKALGVVAVLVLATCCSGPSVNSSSSTTQQTKSSAGVERNSVPVDLTEITRIQGKGRVQDPDFNRPLLDRLIAQGPSCIPFLIDHLDDETRMNPGVIDLWNRVSVGDVALIILNDLFTDSSLERTTVPEARWYTILEYSRDSGKSAEQALREFVRKHGRGAIKAKWTKIWEETRDKIYWDETERCFNIRK